MYALGIDLGTTYTAAATWRNGHAEIASLGSRSAVVPSVVLLREDETVLTGEPASRRGLTEPHRVAREFKRRLGDPTPILLGGVPHSAQTLMASMLRWVLDEVSKRQGGPPASICVSHPANWGPYKTDLLTQAVRLSGTEVPVSYITEPEAAAVFYARQQRIEPGATVAVYDLGGGTFDATVLRMTETGFELLGQPEGVEHLGGIDFDAAVFNHVRQALGEHLAELDEDDPAVLAAVSRLREECVAAKETLSADTDASIPVLLPNVSTEVRITRAELEAMVRPVLHHTIEALRRALRSAQVSPEQLHSVLLVGGSSRMPLVAQMVGAELGRPVAVDAHPKHAVALGAAWLASGAVGVAPAAGAGRPASPPLGTAAAAGAAGAAAAGAAGAAAWGAASAGAAGAGTGAAGAAPTTAAGAAPTTAAGPAIDRFTGTAAVPPGAPPGGATPPTTAPMGGPAWGTQPAGPTPPVTPVAGPPGTTVPGPRTGAPAPPTAPGTSYAGGVAAASGGAAAFVTGSAASPPPPVPPPAAVPAGSPRWRRPVLIGAAVLVIALAAGTAVWAATNRDSDPPPTGGGQTAGPSSDPTPGNNTAAPVETQAPPELPPDEQCTDAIMSNERWVCLTSARWDGATLVIEYEVDWGGVTPNKDGGYHLHLYGGDGTNPPDTVMGSHAPPPRGPWMIEDQPSPLTYTEGASIVELTRDQPKVCARIANSNHHLVPDSGGPGDTYRTGNCVTIDRG